MIISNIIGGLGNQMFQYAAGKSLSINKNEEFKIDIRNFKEYFRKFELNTVFDCEINFASKNDLKDILSWQKNLFFQKLLKMKQFKFLRKKNFIVEPHFHYWEDVNKLKKNLYLYGYWQSEKYFIKNEKFIRKNFLFKQPLINKNFIISNEIKNSNSVSLHIRRSDYLTDKKNSFIGVCSIDYYKKAISIISSKITNPVFFFFSDEIEWVKKNFTNNLNFIFVDHNDKQKSHFDLQLMSLCRHNIIANSSFSWWGAWLNTNANKIVIAPQKWFQSGSMISKDIIPNSWLQI
jgi:hypothetical protein